MGSGRLPAVPGHLFSGVSPVLQEVRSYLPGIRGLRLFKEWEQVPDSKGLEDFEQKYRERDLKEPVSAAGHESG